MKNAKKLAKEYYNAFKPLPGPVEMADEVDPEYELKDGEEVFIANQVTVKKNGLVRFFNDGELVKEFNLGDSE